ncbi:MAG: bifunctional (p)ppGpp synthetase/guanosine-3',5'-bis(diphosphate) 3'-pyrophosphohydrolase, partial [Proteobacteria bacterium]|nr:bifunctional (p)ppGpp synthetase/guanosine-3',5'-bis(diphosphate) 3'-pyrophosphohydrolase [Pseudomonadota bacterium]
MRRIENILDQIASYHPMADLGMVQRAYIFSAQAHKGQTRLSGEPYLSHPLEVAGMLADIKLDVPSVTSGLLHDTVEDTRATIEELSERFGPEVAGIVDGVTKISQMKFATHTERQAENMRKMIVAMATDIRVLLVKLTDRMHNMRTLGFLAPEKQAVISQETLDIYAPLAGRLGMQKIKSELEDHCLYFLEPETYQEILTNVASRRGERESYIKEVIELISGKMMEFNVPCEVSGRPKHLYSIYQKMIQQNLPLNQVFDITAFRIIVETVKDCYSTLGVIHSIFKPIPGRFKDYISLPKANGYQSLHTTLIGPRAERMEIQIRSREMHEYAENGIASHWRYKEGDHLTENESKRFAWLRTLLEWQRDLKDPAEFLSSVREGLFPEDVFVFTPAGDVRELPRGATPVDFAYVIHTEVGHRCIGAKVNGSIIPLKYQLRNGDTVEILTAKNSSPSKDWLNFVVTPKARNRIRQWFKVEERERALSLGREMLEKGLRKHELNFNQLFKSGGLEQPAKDFSLTSQEDLVASVGFGKISVNQVAGKLKPMQDRQASFMDRMVRRIRKRPKEGIKVRGVGDVLLRFAGCCNPVPGEEIVGYITIGRGVSIHSARCKNVS